MSSDRSGAGMLQGIRHGFPSLDFASFVIFHPFGGMLAADRAEAKRMYIGVALHAQVDIVLD